MRFLAALCDRVPLSPQIGDITQPRLTISSERAPQIFSYTAYSEAKITEHPMLVNTCTHTSRPLTID